MIDTAPRSLYDLVGVEGPHRPNILLVILDCVGEAALDSLRATPGGLKLPPSLQGQFVRFSQSVSSGSWTLPSHASLLTGLPPWEHGVHGRGAWKLPAQVPTLAEALGRSDYATACISANGFLGPFSGLCRGFDETHVGSWSEVLQRGGHRERSPIHVEGGSTGEGKEEGPAPQGIELASLIRRFLLRNPGVLDSTARAVYKLAYPGEPFDLQVSSWVEPTLRAWTGKVERGRPLFCVINYLDAHEPYYRDEAVVAGLSGRLRYAFASQDQTDYLVHPRTPDAPGVKMLRQLYLGRVRYLFERLGRLVEVLKDAGRWEETLLIVTSDHGQAFGAGGSMFHGLSIDDSVTRVPLFVRFPRGAGGDRTCETWTSALDVAATIRSSALGKEFPPEAPKGTSERAVACVSDGVTEIATSARFPKATQDRLDHVLVAVYGRAPKVVYDACHERFLRSGEPSSLEQGESGEWAKQIGRRMLGSKAPRSGHLAAWGYE